MARNLLNTQNLTSDVPKLVGEEGFDRNEIGVFKSLTAHRKVIAGPQAGKPSTVVLKNGDILISHIKGYHFLNNPMKTSLEIVRSNDGGKTWSAPIQAVSQKYNPADNYLVKFPDGRLQICFMQLVQSQPKRPWQGPWLCESLDDGKTWSEPWKVDISRFCPAGPYGAGDRSHIVTPDGRLFLFLSTYEDPPRPFEYVMISKDFGRTFDTYIEISENSGDGTFARCSNGRIIAALRINGDDYPHRGANPQLAKKSENVHFMGFTYSDDECKTWSKPVPVTGFNEIPAHIIELNDGRLLLSYGIRHYPLGIQCVISDKNMNWNLDERIILAWHGGMHKLAHGYCRHTIGHPHSCQLSDRSIITAYYRLADPYDAGSCHIEVVKWSIPDFLK